MAAGRLVRPLAVSFPADFAVYLVRSTAKPLSKCARHFYDWVPAKIARTRRDLERLSSRGAMGPFDTLALAPPPRAT